MKYPMRLKQSVIQDGKNVWHIESVNEFDNEIIGEIRLENDSKFVWVKYKSMWERNRKSHPFAYDKLNQAFYAFKISWESATERIYQDAIKNYHESLET